MGTTDKTTRPAAATTTGAGIRESFHPVAKELEKVEELVSAQARSFDPAVEGYVAYVCSLSGKRIRPALALLAGAATGPRHESHLQLGLVLELIHVASLVHDDVMDGADQRRSKKTANAKWGNALTVLLGDALFAHALMLSTEFEDSEICREIALASREVCTGEILQTQRRFDMNLTEEDYFRIIEMKTAALFGAATEMAGVINKVSDEARLALRTYGRKLGTAYQIYDDCLDLVGDSEAAGKTLRTDLEKGKLTLPVLNLIKHADERQRTKLGQLLVEREPLDVATLADIADYEGAIIEAVETAQALVQEARDALQNLGEEGEPESREALDEIAVHLHGLLDRCRV